MSVTLPDNFKDEIRRLQIRTPFVWLWQLTADTTESATTTFYLARANESITWNSILWRPWNMKIGEFRQDGTGDIPTLDLTLDNCTRTLSPYLHVGQGFIGTTARAYIVNTRNLGSSPLDFVFLSFAVQRAAQASQVVTFTLELVNWNSVQIPQDRFSQYRCRWIFGSDECGYVINGVAAYTTCNKTIPDCVLRGLDMKARGLPQLQPGRFGGFIGIPVLR